MLRALDKVTGLLSDLKSDLGSRLDYLTERNLHLQVAVEKIGRRLDSMSDITVKEPPVIATPQQKIQDGQLTMQIKTLRTEIFKLTEENADLRKRNRNTRRLFEPRSTFPNEFLESVRSENCSNDDFLMDHPGHEAKKKVREFCLDSNPSHSIKGVTDPRLELISDKDERSDVDSVKTSKGGVANSKFGFLALKQTNEFKLTMEAPTFYEGHTPEQAKGARTDQLGLKKHHSNVSSEKPERPERFQPRPSIKQDLSDSRSEESKTSGSKPRLAKTVKDFSDFQNLLRDLKNSLNASIYASFNNDIEENVQLLTTLLEKYKALDDQIETVYQSVKAKRRELRHANDSVSGSRSSTSNFRGKSTTPQLEQLRTIRKRLGDLRRHSNLSSYEQKLVSIQSNPSDLESFLYTIKGELAKREIFFAEIKRTCTFDD